MFSRRELFVASSMKRFLDPQHGVLGLFCVNSFETAPYQFPFSCLLRDALHGVKHPVHCSFGARATRLHLLLLDPAPKSVFVQRS